MKLRPSVIASVLIPAGLLVAACGGSSAGPPGSKTAAQMMPAIKAAMTGASSVHIVGTLSQGSQKISIDASLNGADISGTISEGSSKVVLLVVAGNVYLQVNSAYLKTAGLPTTDCSTLCGKYVQAPASDVAQFTAFDMSHLMHGMADGLPSAAGDTTDLFEPATFEGHPVLRLTQAQDTVDVARTGTPYPLFVSNSAHGSADGSLTFSDWNSVPPVTAPAASQIIQA